MKYLWLILHTAPLLGCRTPEGNETEPEVLFASQGGPLRDPSDPALVSVEAWYLLLRANGTFSILRPGVEEKRGRWRRTSETDLELESSWARNVAAGSVVIRVGGNWREFLPGLQDELRAFLRARSDQKLIPKSDLEAIRRFSLRTYGLGSERVFHVQPLFVSAEQVSREEVERAIEAITSYLSRDDQRVVHVRRVSHCGKAFLYWLDGGEGYTELSESEIRRRLVKELANPCEGSVETRRLLFEVRARPR